MPARARSRRQRRRRCSGARVFEEPAELLGVEGEAENGLDPLAHARRRHGAVRFVRAPHVERADGVRLAALVVAAQSLAEHAHEERLLRRREVGAERGADRRCRRALRAPREAPLCAQPVERRNEVRVLDVAARALRVFLRLVPKRTLQERPDVGTRGEARVAKPVRYVCDRHQPAAGIVSERNEERPQVVPMHSHSFNIALHGDRRTR